MRITPKALQRTFPVVRREQCQPPMEYLAAVAAMMDGLPAPEASCTLVLPADGERHRWATLALCGRAFVHFAATGTQHGPDAVDEDEPDGLGDIDGWIRPLHTLRSVHPVDMHVVHSGWSLDGHADVRVRCSWSLDFEAGPVLVQPSGGNADWENAHAFARAVRARISRG